jgi:hypothetical protein
LGVSAALQNAAIGFAPGGGELLRRGTDEAADLVPDGSLHPPSLPQGESPRTAARGSSWARIGTGDRVRIILLGPARIPPVAEPLQCPLAHEATGGAKRYPARG